MTRDRVWGADVPFCAWLRKQSYLPSYSAVKGVVATDVDLLIHRYLDTLDTTGTRQLQSLIKVEVKTRGGHPSTSQLDTWLQDHLCVRESILYAGSYVRHWGNAILSLSGEDPDDSDQKIWARFPKGSIQLSKCGWNDLVKHDIDTVQLLRLLAFELHPDSLTEHPFRRHHKTHKIVRDTKTPLGFVTQERVTVRS